MIKQKIKSKEEACKVAEELARDLKVELSIFECFKVETEDWETEYKVKVSSPVGSCNIITDSSIRFLMPVIDMYMLSYNRLDYHIDVEKVEDRYIPAIVVCIVYEKSEQAPEGI